MNTVEVDVGKTISSPYIKKQQWKHFVLLDIAPHVGLVLAVMLVFFLPFGIPEMMAMLLMWMVTGIGITVGYHRLFTHKAFQATPGFETLIAISGSMAGQGGVISWSCLHRRHHQLSDREGDPHSPNLHGESFLQSVRGILHSHFLWMKEHDYPNPGHYVRDLLKTPHVVWVNKHYYKWVVLGIILPALFVGLIRQDLWGLVTGALWGGAVRLVLLGHTIWAINSFLHVFGHQTHYTSDNSRNAPALGLLTFGESFHNAHHAHPRSALFGIGAPAMDPGYWFIAVCQKLGFIHNVVVPNSETIANRRVEP